MTGLARSGEAVRPTREAIADAALLHGQALLLEMVRVHRRTGAGLHLVFDLEHLATVGLGAHTEKRQQLALAVVDRARVVPLAMTAFVLVVVCA